MQAARSILFFMLFYPATLVHVIAGLAIGLVGTEPMRAVVHGWANLHHWLARYVLGIRTRLVGTVPSGPYLIAMKHQSMFETVELLRVAETPVVVLKRELATMPFFGWIARRYGVIPVDREAGSKALRQMVTLGRKAIADGRPVAIFPEGTRVPLGEKPPLRAGFAGLYRALGLPVVPIAVDSGRLWGRDLVKKSGTVTFLVGEIIPAGLPRQEIEERVHAAINALED